MTQEASSNTVPCAICAVSMSGRLMLMCDTHARALIDLADGNGVKLQIQALDPEAQEPCQACWAAWEAERPRIILPD